MNERDRKFRLTRSKKHEFYKLGFNHDGKERRIYYEKRFCFLSQILIITFPSLPLPLPPPLSTLSLFHKGLYGANGILPAETQLKMNGRNPVACFKEKPTLLWFAPDLGLSAEHAMELLCILGCLLSVVCLISGRMRDSITFGCLWFLYLSVYQVSFLSI